MRVVAVAAKENSADKQTYGMADESALTLVGYIAFLDPPKESTEPAIEALQRHGVRVKVLTGDNDNGDRQGLPRCRPRMQAGIGGRRDRADDGRRAAAGRARRTTCLRA